MWNVRVIMNAVVVCGRLFLAGVEIILGVEVIVKGGNCLEMHSIPHQPVQR